MSDDHRTRENLLDEIQRLRQRVADLEADQRAPDMAKAERDATGAQRD